MQLYRYDRHLGRGQKDRMLFEIVNSKNCFTAETVKAKRIYERSLHA
jgi:hypothetical protein